MPTNGETPMIAYHGKQQLKDERLVRVRDHRDHDRLVAGTGWQDGIGCAVGCTLNNYSHKAYEDELGIPVELAHLEDSIFEELAGSFDDHRHLDFPTDFLDAITPGADLSLVHPRFCIWLLGWGGFADTEGIPQPRSR